MSVICIPIPEITSGQNPNITVSSGNITQFYKLETFDCSAENKTTNETFGTMFVALKSKIENYDKSWELIQVFVPENESMQVKVLFRKNQI
jgi:hypothetical protein